MAGNDDDFDDFDFDDLPASTLIELENNAIRSTQHAYSHTIAQNVLSPHRQRPLFPNGRAAAVMAPYGAIGSGPADAQGAAYGFEDEDVIDLDQQEREVGKPDYDDPYSQTIEDSRMLVDSGESAMDVDQSQGALGIDVSELQSRIQQLERERTDLLQALKETRESVISKAGENAIVRRNHDRAIKEYERRISTLHKEHADALAQATTKAITKQKDELEKTRREREAFETKNRFLEHELAQEGWSRQGRKPAKEGAVNKPAPPVERTATTPQKMRTLPFRDGFDDGDILLVSPSKRDRSKATTPKGGAKRKRAAIEGSPGLPLSEPREPARPPLTAESSLEIDLALLAKINKGDDKFLFLQRLLNHSPSPGQSTFFEALTRHALPSAPKRTLATVIFDDLAKWNFQEEESSLPLKFCKILLTVWEGCMKEQYYGPLFLFTNTLEFVLAYEPADTTMSVATQLLPLIVATVDLVAIPAARAYANPATAREADVAEAKKMEQEIDAGACLSLLRAVALNCAGSTEVLSVLWQQMAHDFVLLMLMRVQPLRQIVLMVQLLGTSAMEASVGSIAAHGQAARQARQEADTLDRLTSLLFDRIEARPGARAYSAVELGRLRIEVLNVLAAFSIHAHGGDALAGHRLALGRLIRFLHDQIHQLYGPASATHALTAHSINLAMRLVYHLATAFAGTADMRSKLGAVAGGAHKHLVALTRLAFSDALVLEHGIEDEAIDAAHQLLDEYLSPEEGDAVVQVFSTGRTAASEGVGPA